LLELTLLLGDVKLHASFPPDERRREGADDHLPVSQREPLVSPSPPRRRKTGVDADAAM